MTNNSKLFETSLESDTRNLIIKQSLDEAIRNTTDIKIESNISIPYINKLINYFDITNQLQSRFLHIGQTSSHTQDHGREYKNNNTFAPSIFNMPNIHIARVDANGYIQTTTNMSGIKVPIMDEYVGLQLPTFDPNKEAFEGINWKVGRTDSTPEKNSMNYVDVNARYLNKSPINPTNIYYTKLSFRELIRSANLFNGSIHEFVIMDFPVVDSTITLMIPVSNNPDGTITITPSGEEYVKRKLLEQQLNVGATSKTVDVINFETNFADVTSRLSDSDKESFIAELRQKQQDLANVYLKKGKSNNFDTILKQEANIPNKMEDNTKKSLDQDQKDKIYTDLQNGLTNAQIVEKYQCHHQAVRVMRVHYEKAKNQQ